MPTREQGPLLQNFPQHWTHYQLSLLKIPTWFSSSSTHIYRSLGSYLRKNRPSANPTEAWKSFPSILSVASSQLRASSLILMLIISYICFTLSCLQSTFRSIISSTPHHQPGRSAGQRLPSPLSSGGSLDPGQGGVHPRLSQQPAAGVSCWEEQRPQCPDPPGRCSPSHCCRPLSSSTSYASTSAPSLPGSGDLFSAITKTGLK